jgi:hypothetical protein
MGCWRWPSGPNRPDPMKEVDSKMKGLKQTTDKSYCFLQRGPGWIAGSGPVAPPARPYEGGGQQGEDGLHQEVQQGGRLPALLSGPARQEEGRTSS